MHATQGATKQTIDKTENHPISQLFKGSKKNGGVLKTHPAFYFSNLPPPPPVWYALRYQGGTSPAPHVPREGLGVGAAAGVDTGPAGAPMRRGEGWQLYLLALSHPCKGPEGAEALLTFGR